LIAILKNNATKHFDADAIVATPKGNSLSRGFMLKYNYFKEFQTRTAAID